ncbi:hypothetical protein CR513_24830 [Mucuna pruriens]|uniref:Secreted protein n=1 Tax=Mucuna pruriens TaxID=157652 RepID=A0A371GR34_MUCPR|nr:hypothetical protein CR513_24830 [Mucuna pruriens]
MAIYITAFDFTSFLILCCVDSGNNPSASFIEYDENACGNFLRLMAGQTTSKRKNGLSRRCRGGSVGSAVVTLNRTRTLMNVVPNVILKVGLT